MGDDRVGAVTQLVSSSRLGALLGEAKSVYVSACASEIAVVPDLLAQARPRDATVTGIFSPLVNRRSYADPDIGLRLRSFFLTRQIKESLAAGWVDYCPWRYGMILRWLSARERFDTALVMVSPPDAEGRCSLGVQVDFLPAFVDRVPRVIGFVNPNMPHTVGDAGIAYADLAAVVDHDVPLPEMAMRPPDAVSVRIAERIVDLVHDGATVQFGVGQIPSQVLGRLGSHRRLRVHSGVIDDHILTLEASGALDPDVPIVTGTAVGSSALYAALGDARRFRFRGVAYTHAHATIAGTAGFTAINSVLRADLLGQVSAEAADGRLIASPGGLPDFARGALNSPGGVSIVAVQAGRGDRPVGGIVSCLSAGSVTGGGVDADVIVTEYGVARLRDLSMDARAEAMIAVAAPEDRDMLAEAWRAMRRRWLGGR